MKKTICFFANLSIALNWSLRLKRKTDFFLFCVTYKPYPYKQQDLSVKSCMMVGGFIIIPILVQNRSAIKAQTQQQNTMSRTNKKNIRSVLQRQSKDNFYANMHAIIPALFVKQRPEKRKKKYQNIAKVHLKAQHHLIYHEETPQKEIQLTPLESEKHDLKKTPNTIQDSHKIQQPHEPLINVVCQKTVKRQAKSKHKRIANTKSKLLNKLTKQLSITLFNSIEDYFS